MLFSVLRPSPGIEAHLHFSSTCAPPAPALIGRERTEITMDEHPEPGVLKAPTRRAGTFAQQRLVAMTIEHCEHPLNATPNARTIGQPGDGDSSTWGISDETWGRRCALRSRQDPPIDPM